jgi:hypothetical protein
MEVIQLKAGITAGSVTQSHTLRSSNLRIFRLISILARFLSE